MRTKIQKNFGIVFVGLVFLLCATLAGCGKQLEMTDVGDTWSYNLTDNTLTVKKKTNNYQFKINLESPDSFETQDSSNGKVVMFNTSVDSFVVSDCSSTKEKTEETIEKNRQSGKYDVIKNSDGIEMLVSSSSITAYLPQKEMFVMSVVKEKPSEEQINKMFEF